MTDEERKVADYAAAVVRGILDGPDDAAGRTLHAEFLIPLPPITRYVATYTLDAAVAATICTCGHFDDDHRDDMCFAELDYNDEEGNPERCACLAFVSVIASPPP